MTKTLLTSIAALFLATGTAHARPWNAFDCGETSIESLPAKYFWPVPDAEGKTHCDPCDGKGHAFDMITGRRVDRWLRMKGDTLFYKGKACQEWDEEDYK